MADPKHFIREVGKVIGESYIRCTKCNDIAVHCEETTQPGYESDECLEFQCKTSCPSRGWAFCKLCKKRFGKGNIRDHATSKTHVKRKTIQETTTSLTYNKKQKVTHRDHGESNHESNMMTSSTVAMMSSNNDDTEPLNQDYDTIGDHLRTNKESDHSGMPVNICIEDSEAILEHPTINLDGNEWLAKLFEDAPTASWRDLRACFENIESMKDYWTAEHASPPGRCGGGIRWLVAKTFQNADAGIALSPEKTPSYVEARWQFDYFLQYHSMDEKQRQRQARIMKSIMDDSTQQKNNFFQQTYIPDFKEFSKMYGKSGKNSIWNNLPIPPVEHHDGVAYVSPINIIKYLFANGVPVDDMYFDIETTESGHDFDTDNNQGNFVEHVSQCQRTRIWVKDLSEKGSPKMVRAILLWSCDWKDGFGPSRIKNNRGSVDAMTITLAPRKNSINGIQNTFLVAVGLKRSKKGWDKVGHRFNEDIRLLSLQEEPFYVYHGVLRKMVPVCFKRYVSIEDKVERSESTGTIACTSDVHRCYGTLGKIFTPTCDTDAVRLFLAQELLGAHSSQWGWCDQFINRSENINGAKFPSCRKCREANLRKLGVIRNKSPSSEVESDTCDICADWVQQDNEHPQDFLDYPVNKHYPHCGLDGCPVQPPKGREPGLTHLPQLKLTFDLMICATKYTFYHFSRPKGPEKNWSKLTAMGYLNACGMSEKIATEVLAAAEESRDVLGIDYNDKEGVGSFRFPAPWLGDLSISDYIETIMHLLYLGIAQSLMEITTIYLKGATGSKHFGMDSTKFRRGIQPLLLELQKFQLGWLFVYPFSGKDFKTGAWVSENWMAFVRISPILFGWCCRDLPTGIKNGFMDVARTILSFHALAARVMTHGGINPATIDETEYLMREFLSCVRELDVRLRHETLGRGTETFWLRPNFMSLLNLIDMMIILGPLILWWDGGGKGEKFIQEIKPHIRRGVREDYDDFFPQLTRKMYRGRQKAYTEQRLRLQPHVDFEHEDDTDEVSLADLVHSLAESESDDDDIDKQSNSKQPRQGEVTDAEDSAMFKDKTIYIYRNESALEHAVTHLKPIAGYLHSVTQANGEKAFEFLAVYRRPVKEFAQRLLTFNDNDGVQFHGMWYSTINVNNEPVQVTNNLYDIQDPAKMAAVAVPLHYILEEGQPQPHGNKYCVITNWWKVRISGGDYVLPTLDASMYSGDETSQTDVSVSLNVEIRDGNEYMQI